MPRRLIKPKNNEKLTEQINIDQENTTEYT